MTEDNQNFGEALLNKIKEEKIAPKPKWQFVAKNFLYWIIGIVCLVLGAIAVSLIIFMLKYNDWLVYPRAGGHIWQEILIALPLFWIICLAVFVAAVIVEFRHTKKGYRYSSFNVFSLVILACIIVGLGLSAFGIDEMIDGAMGRRAPFYDRVINPGIDFWSQPEEGRLMGVIVSQDGTTKYLLVDRQKKQWMIFTEGARCTHCNMMIGQPARFLGEILEGNEFKAAEILPEMAPGGKFFERIEFEQAR